MNPSRLSAQSQTDRYQLRRAVVFDLDGTLAETAPDLHRVLEDVMRPLGIAAPPLPELREMVGDGARVLIERAFAAASIALQPALLDRLYAEFLELYSAAPCRASHLFTGALDAMRDLADSGWALGLCTNKPQAPSLGLLEGLKVRELFGSVIGGDMLPVRKPHPGHLRAVIDELGADVRRSVMVGDSRNDLAAAQALGIPCILVSFGYTTVPARDLGAYRVIDEFRALMPALAELRATP
jgi:phosphoglycolate phosphatase